MRYFYSTVCLLLFSCTLAGQSFDTTIDSLAFWGDVLIHAEDANHRVLAEKKITPLLNQYIRSHQQFEDSLDQLSWVSEQRPPSDSFRLITWQWKGSEGKLNSQGIFQYRGDTALIVLRDLKSQIHRPQSRELTAPKWIGARYFRMIPFRSAKGETAYLLLGYDGYSPHESVQIIDFLRLNDGLPVFGGEFLIDSADQIARDRRILRYMDGSGFNMSYIPEKNRIVFDHLRPVEHPDVPGGQSHIPDGTYEAYELKNGLWMYDEKVYDRILEEPPVNAPEDETEKDVFGRPQKDN